jgi:hypothetical protein
VGGERSTPVHSPERARTDRGCPCAAQAFSRLLFSESTAIFLLCIAYIVFYFVSPGDFNRSLAMRMLSKGYPMWLIRLANQWNNVMVGPRVNACAGTLAPLALA